MKKIYISLIGYSNVGKSYIFNKIFNKYISIINKKSNFTRNIIYNNLKFKNCKIILIDTPGYLIKVKYLFHHKILKSILNIINISNFILYITKNTYYNFIKDKYILKEIKKKRLLSKNILIILNKNKKKINTIYLNYFKIKNIIILNNSINIRSKILKKIKEIIKTKNNNKIKTKNNNKIKTKNNRFYFITDIIRFYIYNLYSKEIPYSIEVIINKILLKSKNIQILLTIYLDKISQKKIFIGSKGKNILLLSYLVRKKIKKIYRFKKVYINFNIEIIKWKQNKNILNKIGY